MNEIAASKIQIIRWGSNNITLGKITLYFIFS